MKFQFAVITILLSFTLSACLPTADNPQTVADKYWQQLQAGNTAEAEKLTLQKNQQALALHSNHITKDSQLKNQSAKAIVSTTITTTNPTTNQVHTQHFDTVLVLDSGKWVVDLAQTNIPPPPTNYEAEMKQLSENINESMQENMESLDDSIQQGMHIFNEALRDGSKEMGDSLLEMMNKLNKSMKQSIEKMKQRREQYLKEQESQQRQQSQPDPSQGEGRI